MLLATGPGNPLMTSLAEARAGERIRERKPRAAGKDRWERVLPAALPSWREETSPRPRPLDGGSRAGTAWSHSRRWRCPLHWGCRAVPCSCTSISRRRASNESPGLASPPSGLRGLRAPTPTARARHVHRSATAARIYLSIPSLLPRPAGFTTERRCATARWRCASRIGSRGSEGATRAKRARSA